MTENETNIIFKETVIRPVRKRTLPEKDEDIFLMRAPKMVGCLLHQCNGNVDAALHRVKKRLSHIGENGINAPALKIAKLKLEQLSDSIRKRNLE